MFTDADIISCYTWADAVEDGTFVDVSHIGTHYGFTLPVAITSNLYHKHLYTECENETTTNVQTLLMELACYIKTLKHTQQAGTNHIAYPATFKSDAVTQVWATIEAKSPLDPCPVMTIMLPEDY